MQPAGKAGAIAATDASAKFGANNIVIAAALTGTATNLNVVAKDTLTLGSSSADTVKAGVKSLEAKSLATVTNGTEFKLQDDVTLSSTQKQNGILVGDSGSITGSAINLSGGKLAVKAGTYEFANNLTITSGSLAVSSSIDADGAGYGTDTVASKLTLTGDIVLQNKANNGISVSGANAVLDLSQASSITTAKHADDDGDIAIAAKDGSTLIMTGEQVTGFVGKVKDSADSKVASITLHKGATLSVTDSLEIAAATLKAGDTATAPTTNAAIMFNNQASNSGGTLHVAKTLTLTDIDSTEVSVGKDGVITADAIKLEQLSTSQENAVKLGAGQYKVLSSLESKKEINLSNAESKLFLGAVDTNKDGVSTPLATTGKITADLNIATGSAAASVVAGDWTAQKNVTAAATTKLNIGDSTLKDANNDPINAKLTVAGKLTAEASTVTVSDGAELVVNEIAASGSALTISGDMTLNGKFDSGANLDDATDDTYGVTLAKGAIVLR